jgi:hypothetical protein
MSEPGRGQIERALAIRECAHDTSAAPDLTHDPLERVVGADAPPVLARKGQVGEGLGNCRRDPPANLPSLTRLSSATTAATFASAAGRLSCAWIALIITATSRILARGTWENALRYQCTTQRCQLACGNTSLAASIRPRQASEMIRRTPLRPGSFNYFRNASQLDLAAFADCPESRDSPRR